MINSKKTYLVTALLLISAIFLGGCVSSDNQNANQPEKQPAKNTLESSNPSAPDSIENTDSQKMLLNQILELAQQGKIINCEFPVEKTVIDTVTEKWGEADKIDYIAEAKGSYATFNQHNVVFGFNKGAQIFDVRSYDSELKQITMSKVKEVLGTPENTHQYSTEDMLVYQAGESYQLLFIFPKATKQNPAPELDHYNVFYPRGTVNSMADDPGIIY